MRSMGEDRSPAFYYACAAHGGALLGRATLTRGALWNGRPTDGATRKRQQSVNAGAELTPKPRTVAVRVA